MIMNPALYEPEELEFYSVSSLKQQAAGKHITIKSLPFNISTVCLAEKLQIQIM